MAGGGVRGPEGGCPWVMEPRRSPEALAAWGTVSWSQRSAASVGRCHGGLCAVKRGRGEEGGTCGGTAGTGGGAEGGWIRSEFLRGVIVVASRACVSTRLVSPSGCRPAPVGSYLSALLCTNGPPCLLRTTTRVLSSRTPAPGQPRPGAPRPRAGACT